MTSHPSGSAARPDRAGLRRRLATLAFLVLAALAAAPAAHAFAGQASSGELFFYPCTTCHPVIMVPGPTPGTERPSKPLPNGFTGHADFIILENHDKLAAPGGEPCLVCHDDPTRNPGKLKLADGTLLDVTGDIALFCYQCHSTKYKEFRAGTHGKHQPMCTSAGCHDPHTPGYIYAGPLRPFVGTGFQFKVLSQRVAFKPLMQPPLAPPTVNPTWFMYAFAVGLVLALALVVGLVGQVAAEWLKR
jgi:hypothetical protein